MRNRTRIFLTAILLGSLLSTAASTFAGQSVAESPSADGGPVGDFVERTAESGLSFSYSYVMDRSKVKITGGGEVTVQGSGYFLEGDGLRVWCDGESVWTYDVGAGEVVIEPADDANGLSVNPVLLVTNLDEIYSWDAAGTPATFGGKSCRVYALASTTSTGLTAVKLYFSGEELIGAEMNAKGNILTFTISNLKFLPSDPALGLSPPTFSSDCVVTDLR